MNKIIVTLLILFSSLNINQMYWDKYSDNRKKEEEKIVEKLTFDISEFIVEHQNKLNRKTDGICWTSYDRIYANAYASYPLRLKAGTTYIAYTYTTGQNVNTYWKKDDNGRRGEIKTGNKVICYFTPSESGNYHYMVESAGSYEGIHVSYITYIIK